MIRRVHHNPNCPEEFLGPDMQSGTCRLCKLTKGLVGDQRDFPRIVVADRRSIANRLMEKAGVSGAEAKSRVLPDPKKRR